MKKRLLRIIATLLCATIILGTVCGIAIDKKSASDELNSFTNRVTAIIRDADANGDDTVTDSEYRTRRLVVKASGDIDPQGAIDVADGYNDLHVLQYDSESSAMSAYDYYSTCDDVDYVQVDRIRTATDMGSLGTAPNANLHAKDSRYTGMSQLRTYLNNNNITYNRRVVVAVVDTGVQYDHELLDGRIIPNDQNYSSDDSVDSYDNNGHGTHVAGIIINNAVDNVYVKPYKVLNEGGEGSDLECYLGIEGAVADGVDVINMNFGGPGRSELLSEAIEHADSQGIVCVAAAGNDGVCMDSEKFYYAPACIPQCITVMANKSTDFTPTATMFFLNQRTARASFSNYGQCCDFVTAGVDVTSSFIGNTYRTMSGTSMAAPFVAAAVTYVILDRPELTPAQICRRMKDYSITKGTTHCLYMEFITRMVSKIAAPHFSVTTCEFEDDFYLELSSDVENADIVYQLTGFADNYWRKYEEPIKIHNNVTVTAFVGKTGLINSDVVRHTYTRTYSDEESKYVITPSGEIIEYLYEGSETELVIPDTINSIVPTSIASYVFKERDFESVYIPDSITSISRYAFSNCDSLQSVVANGVYSIGGFTGCDSLEYIEYDSATSVDASAFTGCKSLTDFDFTNITEIGNSAFSECTAMSAVAAERLNRIGDSAFKASGVYTIFAPSLTEVGARAFMDTVNLQNVYARNLERINISAFSGCTSLDSITLENVIRIYADAFYDTPITEVHLPRIETLGYYAGAFQHCHDLELFDAPLLKALGQRTFAYCHSLKGLYLPSLENMNTCDNCFIGCDALEGVYFPSLTKLIANSVFNGCTSIRSIFIPRVVAINTVALPNYDGVSIFLSDSLTGCVNSYSNTATYTVVAPAGSYAQQWADAKGHDFLDCATCYFSDMHGDFAAYVSDDIDYTCYMPVKVVQYLWAEYSPICENADFTAYGFLLDVVRDGCINAKDYARLRHVDLRGC